MKVYIMDSTTISLFSQILKGVGRTPKNSRKKGGIKAHTIIRADADTPAFIRLTEATVHDRKVMGLAEKTLYKRMKGNFPLKYFLGDSANEIEIQVWVTMIA